jgi:hypothetical protein
MGSFQGVVCAPAWPNFNVDMHALSNVIQMILSIVLSSASNPALDCVPWGIPATVSVLRIAGIASSPCIGSLFLVAIPKRRQHGKYESLTLGYVLTLLVLQFTVLSS